MEGEIFEEPKMLVSDKDHCEYGDKFFSQEDYSQAVKFYNDAIGLAPTNAVYFVKRARCYIRLLQFAEALVDAKAAAGLDPTNHENFVCLALANNVNRQHQDALEAFEEARRLATLKNVQVDSKLKRWILSSQYWLTFHLSPEYIKKNRELPQEENRLCLQRALALLRNDNQDEMKRICQQERNPFQLMNRKNGCIDNYKTQAERVQFFYKLKRKMRFDDYLCCKLSTKFLIEPMTGPSGYSFEKSEILEHLREYGPFDPLMLTPLTEEMLIHNEALEEECAYYLAHNPWAKETYKDFSIV